MVCPSTRRRLLRRACLVLTALVCAEPAAAAETAETILIRQVLEKDRSGRRRGDVELTTSGYHDDRFVVYDAAGSIDARNWTLRHASREDYEKALTADLAGSRYDIARAVIFINVWQDRAFATTIDSGVVIDRASGTRQPFGQSHLWLFEKEDEEWRTTGVVQALGDSTTGGGGGRVDDQQVAAALRRDADSWSAGGAGGILGGLQEKLVVVDAYHSSNPAKWLIVFGHRDEFEEWLEDRLDRVDYDVERTVLHAVRLGDRAVAVTRDRITASYAAGEARIVEDRVSHWLLTRTGGTWKASWVWWKAKPFDEAGGGPTALR